MATNIPNIEFKEGLPFEDKLSDIAREKEHTCLMLDDLMTEVNNSPRFEKLWTVQSHHYNITLLYLTQNRFERGKAAHTISLNTDYYCLFANLRDKFQIMHFAKQAFYGKPAYFMKAYQLATLNPFGYIIVDLDSRSERRFALRSNIFPGKIL